MAGTGRWATLISPSFFVSATHFAPGGSATFYENNDPNGPSHTYSIAAGEEIHIGTDPNNQSDLWLGMLSKPVSPSDNIHYYSVVADDESALINQQIYVVGAPWRVGTNNIANFQYQTVGPSTGRVFNYNYNGSPTAPATEAFLESGDSGAPSFVDIKGQLVLVGVHWYHEFDANNNPVLSGDTFVSQYITQLDDAMTHDFGPGITDQVTVAPVPEPSALAPALRRRGRDWPHPPPSPTGGVSSDPTLTEERRSGPTLLGRSGV